jgi:hypothetical protein
MLPTAAINGVGVPFALSRRTNHSLPQSKLPILQRMASNDNDKHKMEEEVESSMKRKRLWHTDDDGGDDGSSDSPEEEPSEKEPEEEEEAEEEEEVSSQETSMNQLDTYEENMYDDLFHTN